MNAPYATKVLKPSKGSVMAYQSTWLVEETFSCNELIIRPRAVLNAPEGKFLTLTVNGVGHKIEPGTYKGDVVLSVTDAYHMRPGGLMRPNQISRDFHTGIVVEDGKVTKTIPAIIQGGTVEDGKIEGVYMASREDSFNGIVVDGEGECVIKDVKADFDGFGDNDFLGVGCAVTVVGNPTVTIDHCDFTVNGVTRCSVHVGGTSNVTVKNTKMTNICPEDEWPGNFSWQVGFCGSNRLAQFTDAANVTYENCDLKTNGWGILSIDGTDGGQTMLVKNTRMELSGPKAHGYGAFCIGENEVIYDNCDVDVYGYPLLMMGMEGLGKASILGSRIKGRRYGVMINGDDNSTLTIKDSDFKTTKSTFCVHGSATTIDVENTTMQADNGTIVQLMDTDQCGMIMVDFHIPVGVEDVPVEGRDVTTASPTEDVIFNLKDCAIKGNFLNSTTNIRAYRNSAMGIIGEFHDTVIGKLDDWDEDSDDGGDAYGGPIAARHNGDDLRGPKNLGLNLTGTTIEGMISSATQKYRDGLDIIVEDSRMELTNVTQTPAPTVNNGVVITLDAASAWTVTGTSYVTGLTLAEGAKVAAPAGKTLTVTVDGKPVALTAGSYTGKIVLTVE
jgi:hypothetical protein